MSRREARPSGLSAAEATCVSRGHEKIPLTAQSSFQGRGGEGPLSLRAHLETEHLLLSLKKPWASWENTLCVPVPRTQDN